MVSCRLCLDAGHQIIPGAVFRGRTTAQLLLIGQAPGVTEVEAKRPFNAGSGRRLFQWLGAAGWDEQTFRDTHYMTAVTKCYPGKHPNGKGDRVPSKPEQQLCRPYLDQEISLVNPRLILLVGKLAIQLFYPKSAKLVDMIGTAAYFSPDTLAKNPLNFDLKQAERTTYFRGETEGRYIVPLPHPSGASLWPNKPENKALIKQATNMLYEIREAWSL